MLREESFNSFEDRGGTEGAAPLDSTSLDFVKTDVKNMNLDDVQKRIHSMEERNVTRYASVHRQSSLEETEDEIWMRRVQLCVSKLTMLDPARRAHKANLYRYFHIWSLCLPLNQKCDELGKQLRERSAALETVRDSYNRDCITVKFQLENIYDRQDNVAKRGELASIPSVDLRGLIKESFHHADGQRPSNQFQDLLVNGSTIGYTDADKLPWEHGKMFKEQKLNETGYDYKMPKVPVSLVDLHAPSKHKLLVRYCKDCVGLITLVHDWNQAVEDGLNANVDSLQAQELRKLVCSLRDTVHAQEQEIFDLKNKMALSQPRIDFIEKRLEKENDSNIIHELSEKVSKWRAIAEMCDAERETVEGNIRYTFNLKIHRMRLEYDALLKRLNDERETCSFLTQEVEKMTKVFSEHEAKVLEHKEEVAKLNSTIAKQILEFDRCVRSRDEVIKGITAKDEFILEQKEEFLQRIDSLNEKISIKSADNELLTCDIEKLKRQLSEAALSAMQARAKYASDTKAVVEANLAITQDSETLLMKYEDLRSAWHRDYLNAQNKKKRRGSDDESVVSMISQNESKKAEIKRSLMLFPTKMRNSMASAIESVVSLNRVQRRFSSTGSVASKRGSSSRRSSKAGLPPVVPAMIGENDTGDDMSSVGCDMSEDEEEVSVQRSVRSSRFVAGGSRFSSRKPSAAPSVAAGLSLLAAGIERGSDSGSVGNADESGLVSEHGGSLRLSARESVNSYNILSGRIEDNECAELSDDDLSDGELLRREGELLDNIANGMDQLVETVLPSLPSDLLYDRPYSLKVVAHAVRFLLRLRNGLGERRYSVLGAYGLKLQVTSLQKQLALPSASLEELDLAKEKLLAAEAANRELKSEILEKNARHEAAVEKLEKKIKSLTDASVVSKAVLFRERMIARVQRTHAEYLAMNMSVFRARLHLMTHVNLLRESTPPDMVPPPDKNATAGDPSPTKKRTTVRMSFGSRAYSQQQKARQAAELSDEEEENDVTRLPLYKVRKVFFHVLARLRRLKFDRPFRRANSKLLGANHGKAIAAWMVREEHILRNFVRDATQELTEVEMILKRMRQQCSEDRRKAEAFRALLGVETPLTVGESYVGEPPMAAVSKATKFGSICEKGVSSIVDPLDHFSDLKNANQFIGLDKSTLRQLASFRHREVRPELDFLHRSDANTLGGGKSARQKSVLSRPRSVILETTIEEDDVKPKPLAKAPLITHAHSTGEDATANVRTPFQKIELQKQATSTLRRKLRRNAVSGPAGVRPDDTYSELSKYKFEIEKASANEARLERKIEKLTRRVDEVEDELTTGYSEQSRLQAELDIIVEDYDFLRKQNEALKVAISDSYRVCYEKTAEEIQKLGLDKLHFQQEKMRSISTQVACVPCDLSTLDPKLGAHVHTNPKLRAAVIRNGDTASTALMLQGIEGKGDAHWADNVIGPFDDDLEKYVTQKTEFAMTRRAHSPENQKQLETTCVKQATVDECRQTWEGLMSTQNRRATSSPPKPRPMSKARPQSAVQLTTPKAATSDIINGTGNKEDVYAIMSELKGVGALNMDEASMEVRTAASRKGLHHAKHNYATDTATHGVHVSPASQYLQYLYNDDEPVRARADSNQSTTFSKLKAFPRPRTHSANSMSSANLNHQLREDKPATQVRGKQVFIDLNKGHAVVGNKRNDASLVEDTIQSGAIAHMASALQVLHEVRENQMAEKELESRARRLYRSESDRLSEVDRCKTLSPARSLERLGGMGVTGVLHHGGGNVASTVRQENGPPSLTTRPTSAKPPIIMSSEVTRNMIPKFDSDKRVAESFER